MEEKKYNPVQHDGDFGEKHIERPERLQQLRNKGYENARALVQDVAASFNAIFKCTPVIDTLCNRFIKIYY